MHTKAAAAITKARGRPILPLLGIHKKRRHVHLRIFFFFYMGGQSLASVMPSLEIWKMASDSGRLGLSYTLHIRCSPRPLRRYSRVVEAWAMMLPPIGFFGSAVNMAAPSTVATTWLVI